jgi:hypothetical protein
MAQPASLSRLRAVILALVALAAPAEAWSRRVTLWNPGEPDEPRSQIRQYNRRIRSLRAGDELILGPSKRVLILGRLGSGNTTAIYAIEGGRAIRLPLRSGRFKKSAPYPRYVDLYLRGYRQLKDTGIPLVRVFEEESVPGRYLIVERHEPRFTLGEFMRNKPRLPSDEWERIYAELQGFARKAAGLAFVKDLHLNQIVWTERGWILMDYMDQVRKSRSVLRSTIFTTMKLPVERQRDLIAVVRSERLDRLLGRGRLRCVAGALEPYLR